MDADKPVSAWFDTLQRVEALEEADLDRALIAEMQACWESSAAGALPAVNFYTPTFKSFQSSELSSCSKYAWPAVSITGGACKLQCDHCKAKILEPMIPALTPENLWCRVNEFVEAGARGMLLTGGSNLRNEVEYGPFYPTLRRIKDSFPHFKIALHTALVDSEAARSMEQAGVDVAMMDVIGAQDTITQVYHLKRAVEDCEQTLELLVATRMKVVPHIVIGLHYGHLLGEWNALEMVRRHRPDALVLVVVMPFYAPAQRPFVTPNSHEVGRFFMDARRALSDLPLLLGCARPPGLAKLQIDAYAAAAGLDGIAHPAEGVVELAARLGREVRVVPSCCSVAVGEEVLATGSGSGGVTLDLEQILEQERRARARPAFRLSAIKVSSSAGCCGV
jgi:lipoyl synthase